MTIENKPKNTTKSKELRELFIKYFTDAGHKVTPMPEAKNYFHAKQLYHDRQIQEKKLKEKEKKDNK